MKMKIKNILTPYVLATGTVAVSVLYILYRKLSKCRKPNAPKDTVVLYQIGRGPAAPSLSPFVLKLETYLRMANIAYVNDHTMKMSKKGKTPFIEYNGIEVADSQFCIEFLNKEFGIDMNNHLTTEQRSIARAFLKMTEENLFWSLALERLVYGDRKFITKVIKNMLSTIPGWLLLQSARHSFTKAAWAHGIGRHSQEERWSIYEKDMQAISGFIGDKQFMFGEKPCETDCAIFGMLAQNLWQFEGSRHVNFMKGNYPNLVAYCERMKETFWPDWKDCINPSLLK